jgi:hypothetical protein
MFRFLVVPVAIGVLAFSLVYFAFPLVFSPSDVVAVLAEFVLDLSNALFATMPPPIASYTAKLNLLTTAVTVALLITIAIQIILIVGEVLVFVAKAAISIFKRKPKPAEPRVLSDIDYRGENTNPRPGNKILGGGFDSLERD